MSKKKEETAIIVMPMRFIPYTNGRICECTKCHQEAWLSNTSMDAVKENTPGGSVIFICLDCFQAFHNEQKNKGEEIKILPLTDSQKSEL